jgi:anti-sigma factor RsiW
MNSIEEKLWNYIDGSCPPDEQAAIATLIEKDEVYRKKYNELLQLNSEFAAMEMDEPSMAFTYNVMETIRAEQARQPLKAAIDKRIIWGISAFFVLTLAALLIYALATANWSSGGGFKMPDQLNVTQLKVTHISSYFTGPVVKGFLFFDVVMGLFLLDSYLRRKSITRE